MQILPKVPKEFTARGYGIADAVPVRCECGTVLMWEKRDGDEVTCPTCGKTEELPIGSTVGGRLVPGPKDSGAMVSS